MIELGRKQVLTVVKTVEFGIYLAENKAAGETERVLLPAKQVPQGTKEGDQIEVFIYKDSKDRLIATTKEPMITLGQVALLKAKQVTKIGAFLDWGLEKDLLLPFKEQTVKVTEGKTYPVALYIDKSNRLCATMKIYKYLKTTNQYNTGDIVYGTAYEKIERFGMFVAIDNMYQGLIPNKALYGKVSVGDEVKATVSRVHEDGKIELALRAPAYLQIDDDSDIIYDTIVRNGGSLPFNDKSDPEIIRQEFNMSKAAFKRACGHLLKAGKIQITDNGIIQK